MAHMMILNPKRRGSKGRKPSPAQLRARAKFAAAARARAKAAKPNPSKRRRKRKAGAIVKRNPSPIMARKARKSRKSSVRRRRASPLRIFRRKARRNLIVPRGFVQSHMKPAAIGAAGAIVNDVAVGYLVQRLPASMQKPEVRHLVKMITAVGLGVLATKSRALSSGVIKTATVGALTCVMHDAGRTQLQKVLPSVALGEYLAEVIGPWQGDALSEYVEEYPGEFTDPSAFEVEDDDMVIG